jgi:hypothetical protein
MTNLFKSALLACSLLAISFAASAGFFSSKQGKTFKTRGTAVIYRSGTITSGIEKRNIPIPPVFDVSSDPIFTSLTHDSESGWTNCRVPLKSEMSITGPVERSIVFDCYPLSYFPK